MKKRRGGKIVEEGSRDRVKGKRRMRREMEIGEEVTPIGHGREKEADCKKGEKNGGRGN